MNLDEVRSRLFDALRQEDQQMLGRVASEIMGMPIVASDDSFVTTCKYPVASFGDEQWDETAIGERIDFKYIKVYLDDGLFSAYGDDFHPIFIDWGFFKDSPRYAAAIRRNGKILGYVAALSKEIPFEEWRLEAIGLIADAFAFAWSSEGEHSGENSLPKFFLQGLLAGHYSTREAFDEAFSVFKEGGLAGPNYMLVAIETRNQSNMPVDFYASARLRKFFPEGVFVLSENTLYLLVTGVGSGGAPESLTREVISLLRSLDLYCGVSRVAHDLFPFESLKWQAREAAAMGIKTKPEETAFYFDEYIGLIAAEALEEKISLRDFITEPICTLSAYDLSHKTEYVRTLEAYLRHMGDVNETAADLAVHRNTVRYRLEKAAEISGMSTLSTLDLLSLALCTLTGEGCTSQRS